MLFVAVLAGMLVALLASMAALRAIWERRDRALVGNLPAEPAATGQTTGAAAPAASGSETVAEPHVASAEQETEKMRRAALLARHARSLEEAGSLDEAIRRYQEAVALWPHSSATWAQLGRALIRAEEHARAQEALERALEGNPSAADLMNDLGAVLLLQGQSRRALRWFDSALAKNPQFAPAYFNLALAQIALNDRAEARANLEKYLELAPRDARALRELAFLDTVEGRRDRALEALERAIELAPDWALLYLDYAALCALMGRREQAIEFLKKAEPLSSPRAVYQIYLEPAFREIRLTELGRSFERELAQRARARIGEQADLREFQAPIRPLLAAEAPLQPASQPADQ